MHTIRFLPAAALLLGALTALPLVHASSVYDLSSAVVSGEGQNTWAASTGAANSGGIAGTFASTPSNLTYSWTVSASSGTQNTYFIGRFTEAVTLANVGDKLTLSFTVTGANLATGAQAFRFGLFDVGDATTGSGTPAANTFLAATGYRADYGSVTNDNNGIRHRQNTESPNSNLYASATSPRIEGQTNSDYIWASLTFAIGFLEIELLADGEVRITSSFGGSPQASVVTSNLHTTFNAVSFFAVGPAQTNGSLSFSDLSVTYTPIPEPATVALLVSVAALGALAFRRKHGRA